MPRLAAAALKYLHGGVLDKDRGLGDAKHQDGYALVKLASGIMAGAQLYGEALPLHADVVHMLRNGHG